VISVVACCHSVKLCALAARAFWSHHYQGQIRSDCSKCFTVPGHTIYKEWAICVLHQLWPDLGGKSRRSVGSLQCNNGVIPLVLDVHWMSKLNIAFGVIFYSLVMEQSFQFSGFTTTLRIGTRKMISRSPTSWDKYISYIPHKPIPCIMKTAAAINAKKLKNRQRLSLAWSFSKLFCIRHTYEAHLTVLVPVAAATKLQSLDADILHFVPADCRFLRD